MKSEPCHLLEFGCGRFETVVNADKPIERVGERRIDWPQGISAGPAQSGILRDGDGKRFKAGGSGNV